jgi:prefoldin subunit 4
MSSSGGSMLTKQEESEAEVRREDQENINSFGRLNARLQEVKEEQAILKKKMEQLDDASTELMMGSGDNVMLHLGSAFFETAEDTATEYCEDEVEKMQETLDSLETEEEDISEQMKKLKVILYGRFGKSINLET